MYWPFTLYCPVTSSNLSYPSASPSIVKTILLVSASLLSCCFAASRTLVYLRKASLMRALAFSSLVVIKHLHALQVGAGIMPEGLEGAKRSNVPRPPHPLPSPTSHLPPPASHLPQWRHRQPS